MRHCVKCDFVCVYDESYWYSRYTQFYCYVQSVMAIYYLVIIAYISETKTYRILIFKAFFCDWGFEFIVGLFFLFSGEVFCVCLMAIVSYISSVYDSFYSYLS